MQELFVDFITSLDGYGAAEGWPGWWGLEGPEYLAWLGQQPERDYTILMGANTYRRGGGGNETGRHRPDAHPRQPDPVPVAPRGRPGGPFPRGGLPRDHREHRPRPHLRRVSRCHPRDGCQPNVRRQTPAARVRPHGAHRSTRLAPGFLSAHCCPNRATFAW